jgi:hypothetical protein
MPRAAWLRLRTAPHRKRAGKKARPETRSGETRAGGVSHTQRRGGRCSTIRPSNGSPNTGSRARIARSGTATQTSILRRALALDRAAGIVSRNAPGRPRSSRTVLNSRHSWGELTVQPASEVDDRTAPAARRLRALGHWAISDRLLMRCAVAAGISLNDHHEVVHGSSGPPVTTSDTATVAPLRDTSALAPDSGMSR